MTTSGAYAGLSLNGHVALVTGSARGIGATLAVGLAQAGADVAVSDLASMLEDAATTQRRIEDLGRRSRAYRLDVLDLSNIRESVDKVVDDFGRLDILISNAGVRRPKPSLESDGRRLGLGCGHQPERRFFLRPSSGRPHERSRPRPNH